MAQFDVHATSGRFREIAPYLVVVQSTRFDAATTRLVVPLLIAPPPADLHWVMPRLMVRERTLTLDPFSAFAIMASRLGQVVASLADDASSAAIQRAMDEVLSTAAG